MNFIVECKNLNKKFIQREALIDVNLKLESGKIIGLLGPNGSGKTTLIKTLVGLLKPTSGEILIKGEKFSLESKKIISYLPDETYLTDMIKVSDALHFFKIFYSDFDIQKALEMLEDLKIGVNDVIKSMSKGTKEKLQLILVMSRDAQLYLLDEPIGGVDPAAVEYILNTIIKNYSKKSTVLLSTHLISSVEKILDGFIFINNGRIIKVSSVEETKKTHNSVDDLFKEAFKC